MLSFRIRLLALIFLCVLSPLAWCETPPSPPKKAAQTREGRRLDSHGDPLPPGALFRLGTVRMRHQGTALAVAWAPDGKTLASAGMDGAVRLWRLSDGEELHCLKGQAEELHCVAFSPDGRLLAAGGPKGGVRLWDPATGKEVRRLGDAKADVRGFAFSPDGKRLAAGGEDKYIHLFAVGSGKEVRTLDAPHEGIMIVAFSPDGEKVAFGDREGNVYLGELVSGKELRCLAWKDQGLNPPGNFPTQPLHLSWSSDNRLLYVSYGTLNHKLQYLSKGRQPEGILQTDYFSRAANFSIDGRLLALDFQGRIRLYETATAKMARQLKVPGRSGVALSLTRDSSILARGGGQYFDVPPRIAISQIGVGEKEDCNVRLWDTFTGKEVHVLKGHAEQIQALAFSPGGEILISHSADGTVLGWDVASRTHRPAAAHLTAARLTALWADLGDEDVAKAQQAVAELLRSPDSAVPFLAKQLQPVPPVSAERLAVLIADLDHEDFARREKAARELEKLGERALPAIRKALDKTASLEVRRQLTRLLEASTPQPLSRQWLRTARALQVLETTATTEARKMLEELAEGAPSARLSREAKASLQRLKRQGLAKP